MLTISGWIPSSSSVANILAATPGWLRMPAPITLTWPRSSRVDHSTPRPSRAESVSARSSAENTISGPVWMTVSTLIPPSASAPKSCAAETPTTRYTFSTDLCVTPEMSAFSSIRSSSSRIHVPAASEKLDRTCSLTPWLRANSTDRSWSTRAPDAAISSISP